MAGKRFNLFLPDILLKVMLPVEIRLFHNIIIGDYYRADSGTHQRNCRIRSQTSTAGNADNSVLKYIRYAGHITVKQF
jgi:hypothetical protein